ncbi:MAG: mandelate racemase/muconate lactonizing enzyme family protein [Acidobacteria bacterium]|nr:mandelate racemase/muconate lactonizing enzyme family protein [Acidobacteriota bacterium]
MQMRIRSLQGFLLSYVFPTPVELTYFGGTRRILKRDAMLLRVETENGLVGYGPGEGSEAAERIVREIIAPWLAGRALRDLDALRVQFTEGPGADRKVAQTYGTVEVALLDLLGKFHGAPVSELLGGRLRDRIALYGSAGMYQPPEEYAREAALAKEMGFRAYKMRPALGPELDLETVRQMRAATGPDFGLMVDAHSWWRMGDRSYSAETVETLAREMAAFDIAWLEEPLPPEDHAAYAALRAKDIVPIATGEHEHTEAGFLDLIQGPCADFIQADVVCQGGYAMGRRLFGEIQKAGLRFAFHSWGTSLEIAAAAHIGICWPENVVEWLEYPCYSEPGRKFMYEWPLASEMLAEPLHIENGDYVVSREPGLGVRIDESVIERYPWQPGPWSYFTLISPPGTHAVTSDHSIAWAGEPGA